MKSLGVISTSILLASQLAAAADPLSDMLAKGKGSICFDRVYDAAHMAKNPKQQTLYGRLSLTKATDFDGAILRLQFDRKDGQFFIVGGCNWSAKANLDIEDKPLIEAFKGPSGLDCHAETSVDGASAEEGGDFPIDLRDGTAVVVYMPESLAAWTTVERKEDVTWPEFGKDDNIFRLNRADGAKCADLVDDLPYQ